MYLYHASTQSYYDDTPPPGHDTYSKIRITYVLGCGRKQAGTELLTISYRYSSIDYLEMYFSFVVGLLNVLQISENTNKFLILLNKLPLKSDLTLHLNIHVLENTLSKDAFGKLSFKLADFDHCSLRLR